MQGSSRAFHVGIYVFAAGAIFLGLLGLVWGEFATPWQQVGGKAHLHALLAYLTAAIELAGGLALLWRRSARGGALALLVVYSLITLLWIPPYLKEPRSYDPIGNFFEEFTLVVGAAILLAWFSPAARRAPWIARLYGLSAISFGIVHIRDMPGLLTWIPQWLPPSRLFWVYVTTLGFFLAAAALLSGILAPLAARLLTAEIVGFEILVWIPKLVAGPRDHFNWAGNAISIAISGATWVVADALCRAAREAPSRTESVEVSTSA